MKTNHVRPLLVPLLLLALVLSACDDEGSGDSDAADSAVADTTDTSAPADTVPDDSAVLDVAADSHGDVAVPFDYCDDREQLDFAVGQLLREEGLNAVDCGCVSGAFCWGVTDDPPTNVEAVTDCILEGVRTCEPAVATTIGFSVEGDPIRRSYVVVPSTDGCGVVSFLDTTSDAWGTKAILRSWCAGIEETSPSCAPFAAVSCGQPEEVALQ